MEEVETFDAGFRRLINKFISEGFQVKDIKPINRHRYIIIYLTDGKRIMVTYKREPFYNFGSMFRKEGYTGVGDTINVDDLKEAIRREVCDIYTLFPNGIAYKISLDEFLQKSIRWKNKEGKDVRSISIHELKKAFEI